MEKHRWVVWLVILLPMATLAQKRTPYSEWLVKLNIPNKDGNPFYEVIDSLNADSSTIFKACQVAVAESFNDSREVIKVSEREDGHIVGKGAVRFSTSYLLQPYDVIVWCTVDVRVRGNKYRIQLRDIHYYGVNPLYGQVRIATLATTLPPSNIKKFLTVMDVKFKEGMKVMTTNIYKALKDNNSF